MMKLSSPSARSVGSLATLAFLLAIAPARAEFLPDDVHWYYTYGGPSPEPFVFETVNNRIYMGGLFLNTANDSNRKNLARFNLDTEAWESVPGITSAFNGGVWDIHFADDGFIYIGGNFSRVADIEAQDIARFDPRTETWAALTDPNPSLVTPDQGNGPTNGRVFAIQKIGDLLYVGGEFTGPRDSPDDEKYIRSFNLVTNKWAKLPSGLDNQVRALTKAPNGDLVAGGQFTGSVARFDGSSWSLVGGGVRGAARDGMVRKLEYSRDGTLYLCGDFDEIGAEGSGVAARDIAGYKDGAWNAMAGGFDDTYVQSNGTTFMSDGVYDIAVDSEGSVYAGGDFDASNGRSVLNLRHVAKWQDGAWKSLGSGVGTTGSQIVNCIALGREGDLFVGGTFNEGHKNAGSAKYQFARWHPNRDFTDYVPGASDNATGQFVPVAEDRLDYQVIGRPGTSYQLEASPDLINWAALDGAVFEGSGVRQGFSFTPPSDTAGRYYRYRATD